jgi:spore coat protein CotH
MPKQINFLTIVIALMSLGIFWGSHLLYKEWRSHFIDIGWAIRPFDNLLSYQSQRLYERAHHHFTKSKEKGLPAVRLYIPEKARIKLMENPPQSTKKWKKAFILSSDKNLSKVKIRHRGDAARNWAYEKKSWRLKAPKKNLFGRVRIYNYGISKHETLLENYISYYIGRRAGVLSPRSRMVELFINEAPYGVYNEFEHIDESFLRNNEIMPVNIYKGEQIYKERHLTVDFDLFNNPSLWQKTSIFNRAPENDFSDLIYLLNLVREAETSSDSFARLKQVARIDDWALFSAYQTIVQAWHNDWKHNMRLVLDPWKGTA